MDEQASAQLERERLRLETLRLRTERSRLAMELRQHRRDKAQPAAAPQKSWKELLTNPLVLAIVGGSLTLFSSIVTNYLTSKANREADAHRAELARGAESRQLQSELIKSFVKTGDSATARANLTFLIDSGLIPEHEERIKRYLADRSNTAPKIGEASAEASALAACPKLDASRAESGALKFALHVGTNRVSPVAYGGWDGALSSPTLDAQAMARLAGAQGYRTVMALDTQARAECVTQLLTQAAAALQDGDELLLTYSGHGAQEPDKLGAEPDKKSETWAIYDRQVPAAELLQLFAKFKAGVRLVLVQDSSFVSPFRPLPKGTPLAASLVVVAGTAENQVAMDGKKQGAFTEALLASWNDGAFQGSYEALVKTAAARMPASQKPQLYVRGPDAQAGQRPAFR